MVSTALQQYLVAISVTGVVFILSIVECNKKKVVCYCFYWDPALLLQKSYCDKSSAWPRVELRFCPWLSVPIMCIPTQVMANERKGAFVWSIYFILPPLSWIWYTRNYETAHCTVGGGLRSGYGRSTVQCALTYNDERSLLSYRLSADWQVTVSTFDSTYSKFLWVL